MFFFFSLDKVLWTTGMNILLRNLIHFLFNLSICWDMTLSCQSNIKKDLKKQQHKPTFLYLWNLLAVFAVVGFTLIFDAVRDVLVWSKVTVPHHYCHPLMIIYLPTYLLQILLLADLCKIIKLGLKHLLEYKLFFLPAIDIPRRLRVEWAVYHIIVVSLCKI